MQALINAAASRTELSYVSGSYQLVYQSPNPPDTFTDLTINVAATANADTGPEDYTLTLAAGSGGCLEYNHGLNDQRGDNHDL